MKGTGQAGETIAQCGGDSAFYSRYCAKSYSKEAFNDRSMGVTILK